MKRTITGRTASRTMSLGDLRQFIGSLAGLPDEAEVKAKVTLRKHLRSVTVEEDDGGFRDFVRAVEHGDDESARGPQGRASKPAVGELGRLNRERVARRPTQAQPEPRRKAGSSTSRSRPSTPVGRRHPPGWGMLRGCRGRVTGGRWCRCCGVVSPPKAASVIWGSGPRRQPDGEPAAALDGIPGRPGGRDVDAGRPAGDDTAGWFLASGGADLADSNGAWPTTTVCLPAPARSGFGGAIVWASRSAWRRAGRSAAPHPMSHAAVASGSMTDGTGSDLPSGLARDLQRYLQGHDTMVARLDGLGEYDAGRWCRPGPTCSASSSTSPPWSSATSGTAAGRHRGAPWVEDGSVWESAEMWATPDEARPASSTSIGRRGGTPTNRRDAAPRRPAEVPARRPAGHDVRFAARPDGGRDRPARRPRRHPPRDRRRRQRRRLDPGAQAAFATRVQAAGTFGDGAEATRRRVSHRPPPRPRRLARCPAPRSTRAVFVRPGRPRGPAVDHPGIPPRTGTRGVRDGFDVRPGLLSALLINQRAASRWRSRARARRARARRGTQGPRRRPARSRRGGRLRTVHVGVGDAGPGVAPLVGGLASRYAAGPTRARRAWHSRSS